MKRRIWLSILLIGTISIAVVWVFMNNTMQPSQSGFTLLSLKDNTLLLSDVDILSYNWTSQEITLTDNASQRLMQMGDRLYSFNNEFTIKINGEELYRGIFRSAYMSTIPEAPKISIMYPSLLFPSEKENNHALRLFFPWFQPPSDQTDKNLKLSEYFSGTQKLTH